MRIRWAGSGWSGRRKREYGGHPVPGGRLPSSSRRCRMRLRGVRWRFGAVWFALATVLLLGASSAAPPVLAENEQAWPGPEQGRGVPDDRPLPGYTVDSPPL